MPAAPDTDLRAGPPGAEDGGLDVGRLGGSEDEQGLRGRGGAEAAVADEGPEEGRERRVGRRVEDLGGFLLPLLLLLLEHLRVVEEALEEGVVERSRGGRDEDEQEEEKQGRDRGRWRRWRHHG